MERMTNKEIAAVVLAADANFIKFIEVIE